MATDDKNDAEYESASSLVVSTIPEDETTEIPPQDAQGLQELIGVLGGEGSDENDMKGSISKTDSSSEDVTPVVSEDEASSAPLGECSKVGDHLRSSQETHTTDLDEASGKLTSDGSLASSNEEHHDRHKQASGWIQVLALIRKNLMTKFRTPTATFFELFSPLLMMFILAAAYTLSEITYKDAQIYSNITLDMPGPWLGLIRNFAPYVTNQTDVRANIRALQRRQQSLMKDDVELEDSADWKDIFSSLQGRVHQKLLEVAVDQCDEGSRRKLQFSDDDDTVQSGDDGGLGGDLGDIYELLDETRKQIAKVLKSPIPVPSFDQYVGLSLALSNLIGVDDLPQVFSDSTFGRQWGNLLTLGTIHLSPNNEVTQSFWEYLNTSYPELMGASLKVRVHDDEKDALRFINDNLVERAWALLDFTGQLPEEDDFRYKIRMNYTTVPNTNEITNYVSIGLNKDYQMYYLSGYLTLQRTLNEFAFSRDEGCAEKVKDLSDLWSMPMPTAAYSQNPFFTQVGYLLGLTIIMAFLYPTSRLIKLIVEEKETRMKETLFILGLRGWAHWLSWLITSLLVFFIITLTVTAAMTATVIKYSDALYIFLLVGFFSTATIGFCFALAALFSRAKLAAIVGPLALFGSILPRFIFFGFNRYEATAGKMWASLFPATAFAFAADIIADYEYAQQGIQEWNASEGDYSFNTALGLLFFDTLLYMFLGWYLDQVIPREYGVARPFYFLLTPGFWCGCFSRKESFNQGIVEEEGTRSGDIEEVSDPNLRPRVQIKKLVKQYGKRSSVPPAVDNLDLTLYESQITALLGHNGAGKSTTVSVLTGLFPPTSGDCIIYDKSIVHNLMEARQSIGICPQHNVLFDNLTVDEHLAFFMRIKGIRPTRGNVRAHAEEIGLIDYLRTTASALSGGNKRKLSVAIALSGDPNVLILDEPTSAMDPHSRRAVWELLRAKRKGRVTLLTTHFMDEAELLSDRIAVLKEGKLQCLGSAQFLKERFGLGYNLTVVLEPFHSTSDEENISAEVNANADHSEFETQRARLTTFLQQQIPNTELVRTCGKELSFRFPQGTEALFPAAFDALEIERRSLGVGAYGIRNSSLEEVFLQLAEDEDAFTEGEQCPGNENEQLDLCGHEVQSEYHHLSPLQQIGLLYMKRFVIQKRDVKGAFFTVIMPVLVIALVLLVLMLEPPFVGPGIDINPNLYKKSAVGTAGATSILVGGGASSRDNPKVDVEYALLSEGLNQHYKDADFYYLKNASTSADISQYLLSTYNDRGHLIRFGAYVLDDTINITLRLAFDEIKAELRHLSNSTFGERETINLLESLGVDGGKLRRNISMYDLSAEFYNTTGLSSETTLDAVALRNQTRDTLEMIFASRATVNGSTMDEWVEAWDSLFTIAADDFNVFDNGTNITLEVLMDLSTEAIGNVTRAAADSNSSREEFYDWAMSWIDEVVDIINESNSTMNDLTEWNQDWFNASMVLFESSTAEDLAIWTTELFNNVTWQIEQAINETAGEVWNTTSNTTSGTFGSQMIDFLGNEPSFDRDAIVNGVEILVENVMDSLNMNTSLNVSSAVVGALEFLEFLSPQQLGNATPADFADSVTVGILAAFFSNLSKFVEDSNGNSSVTLDDAFGIISEALGGSSSSLDGFFLVELSSAVLDVSRVTLSISTARVQTARDIFISIDNITEWALLPTGTWEYTVPINATASILHNSSSPHAVAAFNQAYSEYLYGSCKSSSTARLVSVNAPLPMTTQQSIEVKTILSVLATLFLLIPFGYIPGAFIVFLVKERMSKSKHLQLVSGVNMTSYWVATYLWDLTLFFLLTICVMVVFSIYGRESAQVFVGSAQAFFASMALTFGYGMSILPFAYLLARNFDNSSSAQISVIGIIFVTGFVAVNAYFIMSTIDTTEALAEKLRPLFRMWPAYNVGEGFIQLASAFWQREILGSDVEPFDWDVTGRSLVLLYGLAPVYFLLLLLLEYSQDGGSGGIVGRCLRYLRGSYDSLMLHWYGVRKVGNTLLLNDGLDSTEERDEDVQREALFVQSNITLQDSAPVVIRDLWKIYPPSVGLLGSLLSSLAHVVTCCGHCSWRDKTVPADNESTTPRRAVRGLTISVQEGETFGLLGSNGAGKTTTLGILTGDIAPTGGEAYVATHDMTGIVPGGVAEARKSIGFCPQTDPLLDLMTGRETLTMFAKLRGVTNDEVASLVADLLDRLTLRSHADKVSNSYSGGNKRKLSLGIAALVGDGGVLLIDECSSGLDPLARKKLWGLIEELSHKRSVILTTHAMEEAEALCTRIGIMAKGQLVAIGSVQHLKTKFLDGYTIDITCHQGAPVHDIDIAVANMEIAVPGSKLSERHGRFLKFDVSKVSTLGLGTTLKRLQKLKDNDGNCVASYSISQCSLEQVFIKLVNNTEGAATSE